MVSCFAHFVIGSGKTTTINQVLRERGMERSMFLIVDSDEILQFLPEVRETLLWDSSHLQQYKQSLSYWDPELGKYVRAKNAANACHDEAFTIGYEKGLLLIGLTHFIKDKVGPESNHTAVALCVPRNRTEC
jgi:hypothetical protein